MKLLYRYLPILMIILGVRLSSSHDVFWTSYPDVVGWISFVLLFLGLLLYAQGITREFPRDLARASPPES